MTQGSRGVTSYGATAESGDPVKEDDITVYYRRVTNSECAKQVGLIYRI